MMIAEFSACGSRTFRLSALGVHGCWLLPCGIQFGISHLRRLDASRGRHQYRKHSGDQHHSGNDVQRAAIRDIRLAQVRSQERSERTSKTPGGQHEAVDWAYILGAEIIGRERGHSPESSSVAEQ